GAAHFTVGSMVRGDQFQTGRLPHTGLVMTSPLEDSVVTDSAAAATAYATGVATKYTRVGVDGAGEARTTVLEVAEQLGKSTGLVTTANFWDATPAAFAAHNKSRYESEDLIRQMLTSGAEIIAGGGAQHFGSEGRPTLAELAESTGYQLIDSRAKLDSVKGEKLFAVYPRADREVDFDEVRLPVLARWAIDHLSKDPDGFFLLIEHEGTDGAAHANLTDKFIASMVSFDEAVGVALDYATARKDVLIVVTGDHETGGLQILREKGKVMELGWATKSHTGEMIPIFAIGPGAETFHGLMTGADVGKKLLQFLRP
ncbi:MAG TPA: alkaline phosphatase, partial [Thermoanaerobaculia bacterium]|nr:alkaline phosphatase [Thermoanaerobaculia bacterium]